MIQAESSFLLFKRRLCSHSAFAPIWKTKRIGVLFTHKNGDFGAISVTERSRAELEIGASHIGWVLSHSLVQCEQVSNRCGSEQVGAMTGIR